VLQARHPPPARQRRRLGHQHRVVRRRHGRRDVADLLHRVQGRGARALARARRAVRPQRACASTRSAPGPVDTPLLQELYAHDPEAAARRMVHVPMGPLRAGARDRQRGAVPRLRRLVVRDRHGLPGRRRDRRART
jgi:hypothetical protein